MKICIITDERSGSSTFTECFRCVNLKVIHDPQTRSKMKFNRDFKSIKEMMNFSFLNADVVKICYFSFSIDKYREILNYCIEYNIHMIFLHRENIYKRALSKCTASNLKYYSKFDKTKKNKPFNIKIKDYKKYLINYNNHIKEHICYLNEKKQPYYFITYEEVFTNKQLIRDLFKSLGLNIQIESNLEKLLNQDYNTHEKNKLILNLKQIENIDKNFPKPIFDLTYKIKI